MIFRQLFDEATGTYTYLLADAASRQGVLVDCVFEHHQRDLALVRELSLSLCATLETHVHADHVTGAWLMRAETGSEIIVSRAGGAQGADRRVGEGDRVQFGGETLEVRETPGHTDGCLTFVTPDQTLALTGDALLIRGAGRTDFQQGSPARLFRSVRDKILSLPVGCHLYPGHDYRGRKMSTVAEERMHNPRLGDHVRREDFIGYMNNLGLPHPQRMADAVPANLACGRPADGQQPTSPSWGPVVRTYAGVYQVEPEWAHRHLAELQVVDVREDEEVLASPMGRIVPSVVVPLSGLRGRVEEVPRGRPVVTVCGSGARSAIAASILEAAGIDEVANLRGGLMRWRALGLPIET
ncbi:MAG: MBL fold metallo-hydrolase [Myxococcota bacterium]